MEPTYRVELRNISKNFGEVQSLRNVDFKLGQNEVVGLLGDNGAGKSTILKTVMGLIDDQPDKGTIEFKGRRIDGKDTEEIVRMGISYVPEGREVFEELQELKGTSRDLKMLALSTKIQSTRTRMEMSACQ